MRLGVKEIKRAYGPLFIAKLNRLRHSRQPYRRKSKQLKLNMSWATNNIFSRWEHMWSDEGIAHCIAIIKGKDQLYFDQLSAATTAAKIKADVKEILEPLWNQVRRVKANSKPALKQLPFTRPTAQAPTASPSFAPKPIAKVNTRACCVGCKKFQIHPNPPPHFTAEDMAHCCALCRLSSGKRHGDHCSRQKA
jgi:hypothetical protein